MEGNKTKGDKYINSLIEKEIKNEDFFPSIPEKDREFFHKPTSISKIRINEKKKEIINYCEDIYRIDPGFNFTFRTLWEINYCCDVACSVLYTLSEVMRREINLDDFCGKKKDKLNRRKQTKLSGRIKKKKKLKK